MMENFKMDFHMGKGRLFMREEQPSLMRESLLMERSMGRGKRFIRRVKMKGKGIFMKDSSSRGRDMGMGHLQNIIKKFMKEIGRMGCIMVMEYSQVHQLTMIPFSRVFLAIRGISKMGRSKERDAIT